MSFLFLKKEEEHGVTSDDQIKDETRCTGRLLNVKIGYTVYYKPNLVISIHQRSKGSKFNL